MSTKLFFILGVFLLIVLAGLSNSRTSCCFVHCIRYFGTYFAAMYLTPMMMIAFVVLRLNVGGVGRVCRFS